VEYNKPTLEFILRRPRGLSHKSLRGTKTVLKEAREKLVFQM
jgi:hypothetical protein